MVSCEDSGSDDGKAIVDASERLTGLDGLDYIYNSDGQLVKIYDEEDDEVLLSINRKKGVISYGYYYEDATDYNVTFTKEGFIKHLSSKETYEDEDDSKIYTYTDDFEFGYDNSGHIINITGSFKGIIGKKTVYSSNFKEKYNWKNGNLSSISSNYSYEDLEDDESGSESLKVTFEYTDEENENKQPLYATTSPFTSDWDLYYYPYFARLYGVGPANLPATATWESVDEDGDEDIDIYRYRYTTNIDDLVSTEREYYGSGSSDYDTWYYSYGGSSRSAAPAPSINKENRKHMNARERFNSHIRKHNKK